MKASRRGFFGFLAVLPSLLKKGKDVFTVRLKGPANIIPPSRPVECMVFDTETQGVVPMMIPNIGIFSYAMTEDQIKQLMENHGQDSGRKQDEIFEAFESQMGVDWGTTDECSVIIFRASPDGKIEVLGDEKVRKHEKPDSAVARLLKRFKFW